MLNCFAGAIWLIGLGAAWGQGDPPADAVLKPTFMTGFDSFSGGTAFVCRVADAGPTLILTAQHLYGPACGWEREFRWDELKGEFQAMTGLSMGNFKTWVTSTQLIEMPGAKGMDADGCAFDIAGWACPTDCGLPSLRLATIQPRRGDRVFLYARERGAAQLSLLAAKVEKATDTELAYRFERAGVVALGGTSGAPVLDGFGAVVAINLGGYDKNGVTVGVGNPLRAIRKMLAIALPEVRRDSDAGDGFTAEKNAKANHD